MAGLEHGVVSLEVGGADLRLGLVEQVVVDGVAVGGVAALDAAVRVGDVLQEERHVALEVGGGRTLLVAREGDLARLAGGASCGVGAALLLLYV